VITDAYISRSEIASLIVHTPGVSVPPEAEDSREATLAKNLTEKNGIIYSTNIEHPPAYPGGINLLYSLLENTVSVTPKDQKIYGNTEVAVLYQLIIQSDGKLYGAGIKESCVQNFNLDSQAELLEREIMKQICLAGPWDPGMMNGEKVNMNIYLPIQFNLDKNRIVIHPSEYLYLFKKRQH
jgi:hypothetical protein